MSTNDALAFLGAHSKVTDCGMLARYLSGFLAPQECEMVEAAVLVTKLKRMVDDAHGIAKMCLGPLSAQSLKTSLFHLSQWTDVCGFFAEAARNTVLGKIKEELDKKRKGVEEASPSGGRSFRTRSSTWPW